LTTKSTHKLCWEKLKKESTFFSEYPPNKSKIPRLHFRKNSK
jgi:hypothetical protein